MRRPSLKTLLLIVLVVVAVTIPIYTIQYYASTRVVQVKAHNISQYKILESEDLGKGKTYSSDIVSVRVKKGHNYTIQYMATSGYQNGSQDLKSTDQTITISPDYSSDKLEQILNSEIGTINDVIARSGTNILNLYTIDRGMLSNYGNWYFTTLTYKGSSDDDSSDTLVVGLQKQKNSWVVVLRPDIIFTTAAYPDVSRDFINAANNYQKSRVIPTE